MEFSIRLADGNAHHHYPLPVSGQAEWCQSADRVWQASISVAQLPAEHIVVPSFSALGSAYEFQFRLFADNLDQQGVALQPVPSQPATDKPADNKPTAAVSTHIDCWHSHTLLQNIQVQLQVKLLDGNVASPPDNYLWCLTTRPLEISPPATPTVAASTAKDKSQTPTAYSQMQAAKDLKQRICSPTALAMALSNYPHAPGWEATIAACFDPATRAYGAWPLAIKWAASCGVLAAAETFTNWPLVLKILRHTPLVCSIRFAKGDLQGAPLTHSGGHLVLLHAADNKWAHVYDPAAPTSQEVARRYSVTQFTRAWLQRRGAAYVFSRQQISQP